MPAPIDGNRGAPGRGGSTDAIANGTYRVDVHHSDKPGITFRYLDGREVYIAPGKPVVASRWRPDH